MSGSFSVSVVLPASGWEMIANVRRLATGSKWFMPRVVAEGGGNVKWRTKARSYTPQDFVAWCDPMDKQHIIAKLRENEAALRTRGVRHAALFGSYARGDNRPGSDIDIMIEIDPDASIDLFEYVAITQYLADLFPNRVDVANRNQLKALVRPSAEQQALYAF